MSVALKTEPHETFAGYKRKQRKKNKKRSKEVIDITKIEPLSTPSPELLSDPKELFLHLTRYTCPFGAESVYYGKMLDELGFKRDEVGNWMLRIGNSDTCFMCHLDTADMEAVPVVRCIKDGMCGTDGSSILGADDRAGLTVLLHLAAHDIPGLYYLFIGEECGCIGSERAAKAELLPTNLKRAIAFDRRGYSSIVTRQCGQRTCSDTFANELADRFNYFGFKYEPDPTGVFTDTKEFAHLIPECTNISIGYEHAHSKAEEQDLDFLAYVCEAALQIDWDSLPTERDPDKCDYFDWDSDDDYWGYRGYNGSDLYSYDYGKPKDKERYFGDDAQDRALAAMDRIIENFQLGLPADRDLVMKLIQAKTTDTADMIELLIDELQRAVLYGSS